MHKVQVGVDRLFTVLEPTFHWQESQVVMFFGETAFHLQASQVVRC